VRSLPVASTTLPAHPASSRAARAFVAENLRTWGLDSAIDDASLLVSELVTNAILHGRSPMELVVRRVKTRVRVEVFNDGRRSPQARYPDAASGQGFSLVQAVATRWGVGDEDGAGSGVWFEIAL